MWKIKEELHDEKLIVIVYLCIIFTNGLAFVVAHENRLPLRLLFL